MKPSSREALSAYYREAGSWAADQIGDLERSSHIAWIVAIVAVAVAVVEGLALIALMPLKTVVPYTLLVDRTTGFVQALKPLEANQITPDRALAQSMLVQYVIARETFDIATLQASYQKVGLWSADQARNDYLNQMRAGNPAAPLARYPRSSLVETRVKSVSRLTANSALVRFDTVRRDAGTQYQSPQPWVAVMEYRFSGEPMSAEDRFTNPLGFRVVSYRVDPEALPQTKPAVSMEGFEAGAAPPGTGPWGDETP